MIVSQLITKKPVIASKNISIREAAKIMKKEEVGSLVIVDKDYKAIGIVTERDLLYAIADEIPLDKPVSEIMSQNPVTIEENSDISEAVALMTSREIRHLIVVDHDGKVKGVISIRDVARAVGAIALDLAFW
ncbi:CBS domain-containing protein [Sulfurisphaera ohwakuensis]|uniref:CBS domain-containing protein n=1 Tax=Sulfurisphaera ohwakuensis TaxID=69656 RepID=A0A650CKJ9_SULOH|nr:CBS domain-containing protein [Sulfurisphaera ohwakuensis]MBB5253937.1 CBS domain-containing protein [Sulfurisphaera ohwakuensis]QGR17997.1 CBS domain-containing protein [Sulfurisphaera ohwakuensis]